MSRGSAGRGPTGLSAGAVADAISAAWESWTPEITASDPFTNYGGAVQPTMGTGATADGRYLQIGKLVIAEFSIAFGTSAAAGTGVYTINLPVTPREISTTRRSIGSGVINDLGAGESNHRQIEFALNSNVSATEMFALTSGNFATAAIVASDLPQAWTDGDSIQGLLMYEAL